MPHSLRGMHICRICYAHFYGHAGWTVHVRRAHEIEFVRAECTPDCGSRGVFSTRLKDWVPYAERVIGDYEEEDGSRPHAR